MSVTVTANAQTARRPLNILADYELQYTEPKTEEVESNSDAAVRSHNQDDNWPGDHRRIPPYRPINYDLDRSQRLAFLNQGERVFVGIMLFGVRINSTVNTIWRTTGGRINDRIFHYEVGGEY